MKIKVLVPIFAAILFGFLFGKIVFSKYDEISTNVFEEKEVIYFIKINTYSKESEIDATENNYLILLEDNIYNVYGGITKSKTIASKIKESYEKTYKNITIEQKQVDDDNFLSILNEYDKITTIALSTDDLISIEKIIISNYKETVLKE